MLTNNIWAEEPKRLGIFVFLVLSQIFTTQSNLTSVSNLRRKCCEAPLRLPIHSIPSQIDATNQTGCCIQHLSAFLNEHAKKPLLRSTPLDLPLGAVNSILGRLLPLNYSIHPSRWIFP